MRDLLNLLIYVWRLLIFFFGVLLHRFHNDWRSETQTVVSLLAFMHWLETGKLLMHTEAEEKLGSMFSIPVVVFGYLDLLALFMCMSKNGFLIM